MSDRDKYFRRRYVALTGTSSDALSDAEVASAVTEIERDISKARLRMDLAAVKR